MGTKKRLKHLENVVWYARSLGEFPNAVVCFDKDGNILIATHKMQIRLDRRTARLVARRINEALDAWNE